LLSQRIAARVGLSPRFTLARYGRLVRGTGALVLLLVLLRALVAGRDAAFSIAVLALLAAVLAVTGVLQNAVAGLYVQYRLHLREGDRVRAGNGLLLEGELRKLSWDHVTLRAPDGVVHHVPNRAFLQGSVQVLAPHGAVPLNLRLPLLEAEDLPRLRDTVALLPYRVPGTPVRLEPDGTHVLVRCFLWSDAARDAAEKLLRKR
jgi:small-conductance mechanosensitive channel